MALPTVESLVALSVAQYLGSGDFNGLPFSRARADLVIGSDVLTTIVKDAVREGRLSVLFGDVHPNPHIRAFKDEGIEAQLERCSKRDLRTCVIYPTSSVLREVVDPTEFAGRPFTLRLAHGQGQLEYSSFELVVLEHYRRDPRYQFWCNDIQGTLGIGDEAYESAEYPNKHKVGLQSFGFSYSVEHERAVAVFLRDLSGLTPEHQQLWSTFEKDAGVFRLHPDYYRGQVLGEWDLKVSLADAFIEELRVVNLMCGRIGWRALFRNVFAERPKEFGFLLRSTRKELNEFTHLLDKMMSENINSDFFPSTLDRESRVQRSDGTVVVARKGSIALLEEWLGKTFRPADQSPVDEMFRTFREVRKLRQKPAHAVDDDAYDPSLFREQRQLFLRAYDAVRTMRLLLSNHPRAKAVLEEMNQEVRNGDIWPM